ncbi:unnamed protein product [Mytilus coruscus]|uniref:Uncharacterized protein n=1 Tax=Mytilus coruscus TaxID=42192 RepID=A0A6J8DYC7_MYTCO|nr:unnamed protein product [Mytilus coruscus]
MLEEARTALHNLVASSNSEVSFITNRLEEKNSEIEKLTNAYQDMTHEFNTVQDGTLSLKRQLSDALDELRLTKAKLDDSKTEHNLTRETVKPTVYLIDTSNIQGINEDKLTTAAQIIKFTAYTLDDTRKCITNFNHPPDIMVLHALTNHLKSKSPQYCVKELGDIILSMQQKWESMKMIVSLTTPRSDSLIHNTNGQIINAPMKQSFSEMNVMIVDHSNVAFGGNRTPEMLADDKFHLSTKGIAQLSSNIKRAIHSALGVPLPTRQDRSRFRINRGRGRGTRGRGRQTTPS